MENLVPALRNTIPISLFNKGMAGKIFKSVKENGSKVVMKNNVPECVLMSPESYLAMTEKLENAELLALALHRIENGAFSQTKDWDEVRKELGISSEDLADVDDAALLERFALLYAAGRSDNLAGFGVDAGDEAVAANPDDALLVEEGADMGLIGQGDRVAKLQPIRLKAPYRLALYVPQVPLGIHMTESGV